MVTVLNTSGTQIHPGDLVERCLMNPAAQNGYVAEDFTPPVRSFRFPPLATL